MKSVLVFGGDGQKVKKMNNVPKTSGMMRDLGIKIAFTFDAHFNEQGFDILP